MTLPAFDVVRPTSLRMACRMLRTGGAQTRVLAGGTDLFLDIQDGVKRLGKAVSLAGIPGLKRIELSKGDLVIGPMVTPNEIAANPLVLRRLPALAEAARSMAAVQVRNLATIGGNIANAVPSADLPPTLIAAEAYGTLASEKGRRKVLLERFFKGPRETVLKRGEILSAITIPALPARTGVAYEKFVRRGANVVAVAAVACRLSLFRGKIKTARVVLGAVAPVPILVGQIARLLEGEKPRGDLFRGAAAMAARECRPITDVRASEEYRRDLVETLTKRALFSALERAKA